MERKTRNICEYTYTLDQDEVRKALISTVLNSTWGEDGATGMAMKDSEVVYHDDGSVSVVTKIELDDDAL